MAAAYRRPANGCWSIREGHLHVQGLSIWLYGGFVICGFVNYQLPRLCFCRICNNVKLTAMQRHRRLCPSPPPLNHYSRVLVAFGVFLCLAYLQLLIGHICHQGHHADTRALPFADDLTRVLTDLSRRDSRETVDTAVDVTCHDVTTHAFTKNALVNAILLARRSGLVLPCHNAELQKFNLSVCTGKCIIAANLHNSEAVLPNMVVQLVRSAQLLGTANVFISIYESGSTDSTSEWLRLLGALLRAISVRFVITTGGNLTRAAGQDRIAFLASVRQAAVDQVLGACGGTAAGFCNASRIVFVNDVFFDATGLIRLLQYDSEALACGMDFEPILAEHSMPVQQGYMEQHLQQTWRLPSFLTGALSSWPPAFKLWRRRYRRSDSLLRLLPLSFYDIWVARDVGGGRFYRMPPYTRHEATAARLRLGLPVSAYCCWNGLVAMQGYPLLSRQVTFRSHTEGECYSSECSLLCDDLHSLGPARVVIDPGVRVSYRAEAAENMYGLGRRGAAAGEAISVPAATAANTSEGPVAPEDLLFVPWNRSMLDGLEVWRKEQGLPLSVECCDLTPGRDSVDFTNGCMRKTPSGMPPKLSDDGVASVATKRDASSVVRKSRAMRLQSWDF